MKLRYETRAKPGRIGDAIALLHRTVELQRQKRSRAHLIIAALAIPPIIAAPFVGDGAIPLVVLSGVIVLFGLLHVRSWPKLEPKVDFADAILTSLADELAPGKQALIAIDLDHYHRRRPTWTGRSSHGNTKEKYEYAWLVVRGALADGSKLDLRAIDRVKTKSGRIVRRVEQFRVRLAPPAGQVRGDVARIDTAIPHASSHASVDEHGKLKLRVEARQLPPADYLIEHLAEVAHRAWPREAAPS